MKIWLARIALAAMLGVSLYRAVHDASSWRKSAPGKADFETFVEKARAEILPDARVLVVSPGSPITSESALLLSVRLHPRILVSQGRADWILEIADDRMDNFRATIRRSVP